MLTWLAMLMKAKTTSVHFEAILGSLVTGFAAMLTTQPLVADGELEKWLVGGGVGGGSIYIFLRIYRYMLNEIDRLQQRVKQLEERHAALENKTEETLKEKNTELKAKDEEIKELNKKIHELEEIIQDMKLARSELYQKFMREGDKNGT